MTNAHWYDKLLVFLGYCYIYQGLYIIRLPLASIYWKICIRTHSEIVFRVVLSCIRLQYIARNCACIRTYGNRIHWTSGFDPKMTQDSFSIKTWSLTLKTSSYPWGVVTIKVMVKNMFSWNGDNKLQRICVHIYIHIAYDVFQFFMRVHIQATLC